MSVRKVGMDSDEQRDGTSYVGKREAISRRLRMMRERLDALGLRESPYPAGDREDELWCVGYEAALSDLAGHPEIARVL